VQQLIPKVTRVAVLLNRTIQPMPLPGRKRWAAGTLRNTVQPNEVQGADTIDGAFARMVKDRAEAVVLFEDAMFATERLRLVALASAMRMPAVYGQRNSVDDGGLISYGPSIADAYRNAATFVDKILKGGKPADLPINSRQGSARYQYEDARLGAIHSRCYTRG
jgi:putative ABC transport system substrate-binding protein